MRYSMPDKSGNYNSFCTDLCVYLESIFCIISKVPMVNQRVMICPAFGINIAHYLFYMNKKQIDNLSKCCYDMSKVLMGLAVVGNILSDKPSWKALLIGLASAFIFIFVGYLLDQKEVDKR